MLVWDAEERQHEHSDLLCVGRLLESSSSRMQLPGNSDYVLTREFVLLEIFTTVLPRAALCKSKYIVRNMLDIHPDVYPHSSSF